MKTKIRVGDNVTIIAGQEKKKSGQVKKIKYPYLYLDKCLLKKKSVKGKGFFSVPSPIHISNVKKI